MTSTSSAFYNDLFVVYGGRNENNGCSNYSQIFDFKTGNWSTIEYPNDQTCKYGGTLFTYNSTLIYYGGFYIESGTSKPTVTNELLMFSKDLNNITRYHLNLVLNLIIVRMDQNSVNQ